MTSYPFKPFTQISQKRTAKTLHALNQGKSALLWLFFILNQDEDGIVRADYSDIMTGTGVGTATIARLLPHLRDVGLVKSIEPDPRDGKSRYLVNRNIARFIESEPTFETKVDPPSTFETKAGSGETFETKVTESFDPVEESDLVEEVKTLPTFETKVQEELGETFETKVQADTGETFETKVLPDEEAAPTKGKKPRKRDLMFDAIVDVCALPPRIDGSYVAKTKKDLLAMEKTPDEVLAFGKWWYANDWRGKQGQPPTQNQLVTEIEKPRLVNGSKPSLDKGPDADPERAERDKAFVREQLRKQQNANH